MKDVLSYVRDERLARTRLRPAIQELRDGMQECSTKARGIESAFKKMLAAANELNLAMGHQMSKFCFLFSNICSNHHTRGPKR